MAFERQSTDGKFVAFGKARGKEGSHIIKKGEYIECFIQNIKHNEKFGVIVEVKTEAVEDPLIITGSTILNKELGYEWEEGKKGIEEYLLDIERCSATYRVVSGDKVRIHFDGMIPVKGGNEAYDLWVEVDK